MVVENICNFLAHLKQVCIQCTVLLLEDADWKVEQTAPPTLNPITPEPLEQIIQNLIVNRLWYSNNTENFIQKSPKGHAHVGTYKLVLGVRCPTTAPMGWDFGVEESTPTQQISPLWCNVSPPWRKKIKIAPK